MSEPGSAEVPKAPRAAGELLCKLIAYNITVLINAMYELKIKPDLIGICSL